jgi:hypothetical protein
MCAVKCVGAIGQPLNILGFLPPVFMQEDGTCFEAGDEAGHSYSYSLLQELSEDDSVILFEEAELPGSGLEETGLRSREERTDRFGLPAHVLYFKGEEIEELNLDIQLEDLCLQHSEGKKEPVLAQKERYEDYNFYLFTRQKLVSSLLPNLFKICREALTEGLKDRMRDAAGLFFPSDDDHLVHDSDDPLAKLSRIMGHMAPRDFIREAVAYEGLILLLSPSHSNIGVWLSSTLKGLNLQGSPELWFSKILGLWFDIEMQITTQASWARMQASEMQINQKSFLLSVGGQGAVWGNLEANSVERKIMKVNAARLKSGSSKREGL